MSQRTCPPDSLENPVLAFGDETIKVVVNTKGHKGNINRKLKELIDHLNEGMVTGAYTRQLDEAVQFVKSSEERGHEYMIMMIRDMEKKEEGRIEGTVETMRDDGKDDQAIITRLISKYGLTQEEAREYVIPDLTAE